MRIDSTTIVESLEAAAAHGDPAPAVYRILFERHPEMKPLFMMGDLAKGNMLDQVFNLILDFIGPNTYATHLVRAEIINHENLGVPPDVFQKFFAIVRDSLREIAASDWTPKMDAAWSVLLTELKALTVPEVVN
jgi:hemoglobin-like flavoprotein